MDLILVRRLARIAEEVPFRCTCGNIVTGWDAGEVARCPKCERPTYTILRTRPTQSGEAREVVILARGVVEGDRSAFMAQGFHVLTPTGGMLSPGGSIRLPEAELTNPDGTLK